MNKKETYQRCQKRVISVACFFTVLFILFIQPVNAKDKSATPASKGRVLASKLCQACHVFEDANQAGTVGPPFISMQQRFPNRQRLRNIIYDPQKAIKSDTMMPPFGRHGFLNKKQTEELIDFIYTL